MKKNIIAIYKDVVDKKGLREQICIELGIADVTLQKYLYNSQYGGNRSIVKNEDRLHQLVINWRIIELGNSVQLLKAIA